MILGVVVRLFLLGKERVFYCINRSDIVVSVCSKFMSEGNSKRVRIRLKFPSDPCSLGFGSDFEEIRLKNGTAKNEKFFSRIDS